MDTKSKLLTTLGPEGSFSHQAALTLQLDQIIFAPSIQDAFDLFDQKLVSHLLLPFENSKTGMCQLTLQGLIDQKAYIEKEVWLFIEHYLAGFVSLDKIKKLYLPFSSYEACKERMHRLFEKEASLESVELVHTTSQALSLQALLKERETSGALLSSSLCKTHQIPILKEKMEGDLENQTRFILISHQMKEATQNDQTSILIGPKKDEIGFLKNIFDLFFKYELRVIKIESRPSAKKQANQNFYLEFEGHIQDSAVQKALSEVKSKAFYQFLGSYSRDN